MKLSYEDHDTISVMTVSGELTADQVDSFRRSCSDRLASATGVRDIVLDIEHMTLIDSAGLELLLWLTEELADRSGQLRVVKPDEIVSLILKVTRLERRFDIHPSIESAAKSLR